MGYAETAYWQRDSLIVSPSAFPSNDRKFCLKSSSPRYDRLSPTGISTPFHLILRFQQDDKRPDARRASAGLAIAHSRECNNADGRLSSCPKGAVQIRQCGVAVLGKGRPFPTDCALPWRIWAALKPQNKVKRGTGLRHWPPPGCKGDRQACLPGTRAETSIP